MIIESSEFEMTIRLTRAETARIQVDHGESELVIPVQDTLGVLLEVNDALAGMRSDP